MLREFIPSDSFMPIINDLFVELEKKNEKIEELKEYKEMYCDLWRLKEEFEKLWKMYPKKTSKDKAFTKYKKYRTSKNKNEYCTYEEVLNGLEKYLKYIKQNTWYSPKDGSTWFNNRCWNDEYSTKEESTPEWLDKEIKKDVVSTQEKQELEKLLSEYR